jgi:predicted metal-dependent phosphoesterase TrpH
MKKYKAIEISILLAALILAFTASYLVAEKKQPSEPPRGVPAATHPAVGPAGAPADMQSPIEAMGFGDFRGVIHAHSYMSHDSTGTPERMIQAAQTVGIQFILMTDHPSPYIASHGLRGMHGGILFLPGQEVGIDSGGGILGIDIQKPIASDKAQDVIEEIHKQGGLAILSHIEDYKEWGATGWDAMEIYNTHYDAILDGKIDKTIALIPYLEKNPDRVWQSILDKPTVYLKAWDFELATRKAPGVAANDSHENVVYNGFQLDTYERSYGLVSTHLFMMELNRDEIFRAIRAGHGYVCFDVLAPCRGFSFIATDGKNIAIMGDDFALNPKAESTLEISIPKTANIQLLKDGNIFKEVDDRELTLNLKEPGVYRVEVYVPKGKKKVQWIFSNPIYVH